MTPHPHWTAIPVPNGVARPMLDGLTASLASAMLQTACGVEYTAKLQRMFQDLSVSKELTAAFRTDPARTSASGDAATELDVMVLTAGSWPVAQSSTLMTSPELAAALGTFHGFYHRRFQGRKLTWLYHLSRGTRGGVKGTRGRRIPASNPCAFSGCVLFAADLRVNFAARRYELQTSAFQAAVLLQFNQRDKITVPELEGATSIVGVELTKTLKVWERAAGPAHSANAQRCVTALSLSGADRGEAAHIGRPCARCKRDVGPQPRLFFVRPCPRLDVAHPLVPMRAHLLIACPQKTQQDQADDRSDDRNPGREPGDDPAGGRGSSNVPAGAASEGERVRFAPC